MRIMPIGDHKIRARKEDYNPSHDSFLWTTRLSNYRRSGTNSREGGRRKAEGKVDRVVVILNRF